MSAFCTLWVVNQPTAIQKVVISMRQNMTSVLQIGVLMHSMPSMWRKDEHRSPSSLVIAVCYLPSFHFSSLSF